MADFRKGDPVRVTYDAVYYAEPDHRSDEYALVVLPGTPLDGNVLILNRFRAPITALTKVNEDAVTISRDEFERLTRADEMLDSLYAAGVDNWEGYSEAAQT